MHVCPLHISSSFFAVLVVTNHYLYISPTPSCEWLVDGCPAPTDTSSHPGKVKLSHFYGLEKHRRVGILNRILQDTATKLFKTQKINQIPSCMPWWCGTGTSHFYYNFQQNNTSLWMKQCRVLRWDFNDGEGKVVSVMWQYFMKSCETVVVQRHASLQH